MAQLDQVRISYETDFNKATAELNKFNKEQQKVDSQAKKNQKTFETNAQKRERILKEEQQDLKELQKRSDKAFNPTTIKDYNKRIGETKGRINALKGEQDKATKSQGSFNNALKRGAGLLAGAFAVERIIAFGGELFKTAKEMEAFERRAKVVFGTASASVERFARRNANALGFTVNEFIGATAAIGDILVPLGFARDVSAEMATEAVRLGAALKEFTGDQREASEIANIVAKAFTGEVESLKGLGIVINQNDKSFKDLVKSKLEDEGVTAQQAKALAIYETVLSSANDALVSYESNTESLVRTSDQLAAEFRETSDALALLLTPAFEAGTKAALGFFRAINDNVDASQNLINILNPLALGNKNVTQSMQETRDQLAENAEDIKRITEIRRKAAEELAEQNKEVKEEIVTINTLKEDVKKLTAVKLDAAIGSAEFAQAEIDLKAKQEELAIALGKTTDKFKERLTALRELTRVQLEDSRLVAQEEAEFREAFDVENAENKLTREEEEHIKSVEQTREALDLEHELQVEAGVKDLERAKKQSQDLLDVKRREQEASLEIITVGAELALNLTRAFGNENTRQAKELAVFQIAANEAVAIAEAVKDAQVVGITPIEKAVILAASITSILASIGSARQILNSAPVPQFAKGTKDFKEGGMAEVGERGRETVFLPVHTRVLSHEPTLRYKQELDAMQDGSYENYIQRKIAIAATAENYDDMFLRKDIKKGSRISVINTNRIVTAINSNQSKLSNHRLHA